MTSRNRGHFLWFFNFEVIVIATTIKTAKANQLYSGLSLAKLNPTRGALAIYRNLDEKLDMDNIVALFFVSEILEMTIVK